MSVLSPTEGENALEETRSQSERRAGDERICSEKEIVASDEKQGFRSNEINIQVEPAIEEGQYPTGLRFWLILLNVLAVSALSAMDMNIVATALPNITDYFDTIVGAGWYASAFRLCQCAFQFLFGKAYTLFSIKAVYMLANVIWFCGIALCGTAQSPIMLIIGRAIAGLGTAGLSAGSVLVLVQSMPLHKRPVYQGIQGAVEGLSVLAGPLLGGVLTQYLSWRWCFYINLPCGGVCIMLTLFCLDKDQKVGDSTFTQKLLQLDVLSNILLVPALTCLFLALEWAGTQYSWSTATIIGLLVTSAILLVAFFFNQYRRGNAASLPLRILKNRSVFASFAFIICLNAAGNVLDYYLPTYFQAAHGYTPAQSGYLMIPIIIGGTLGVIAQGVSTSIWGHYGPFMLLSSILMSIVAGLISTFRSHTSLARLIVFTGLSGLAYGFGFCGPQTAIQTVLSKEDIPLGLSLILFAESFGPAVAITVAQALLNNQLSAQGFGPGSIENNGLVGMAETVPSGQAGMIYAGIARSLVPVWYLVVGLACVTFVGGVLVEWRSVKSKKSQEATDITT